MKQYNVIVLPKESVTKLVGEFVFFKNQDFSAYGLRTSRFDFEDIKEQAVQLGWDPPKKIAFVVTDQRQWAFTRVKYGI